MKKVFGVFIALILVGSFFGVGYILIKKTIKPDEVFESASPYYTDIICQDCSYRVDYSQKRN